MEIGGRALKRALAGPALAVAVLASVAATPAAAQRAKVHPEVHITATDYAFIDTPATIKRGLTFFSFSNIGKVRHEMSISRLEPGVSVDQMLANEKAGGKGRGKLAKPIGLLIEPPGKSTISWLAVDLKAGETYLIACTLRDAPDAQPHIDLGMVASFRVK